MVIEMLIPIVFPFILGLIVGIIVKKTIKLAIALIALILLLSALGYLTLPSFQDIIKKALNYLPMIQAELNPLINILPYSSTSFIVGFLVGLWKG